jgi:CRISPR system Cascade subunit CasA
MTMNMDCERNKKMGRYNLLDEPWISVLIDKTGEKEDVSLLDFFRNAGCYHALAGEMETQNFAVMRFLLAIIQTVFSRS